MEENPADSDACFNFFVTAEHMPEWYLEGKTAEAAAMRKESKLLALCSHLANGAKHFEVDPLKHMIVTGTAEVKAPTHLPQQTQMVLTFEVIMSPETAKALNRTVERITVVDFADLILEYWRPKISGISSSGSPT